MRFSLFDTELQGLARSAHQWTVSNNQGSVGSSNVLGGPFRVTTISHFDHRISLWNFSIFGQPTSGTRTTAGKTEFQRRIQRAPINAGLPARNYLKRSRLRQLQPWLVPHSVQTPQAPARITFSLPQCEHVMSINMFPSAAYTRSAWVQPFASIRGFPSDGEWLVMTSINSFSAVRGKSATGRLTAFFSISAISLGGGSVCHRFAEVPPLYLLLIWLPTHQNSYSGFWVALRFSDF